MLAITLMGVSTTRMMILGLVRWLQPVHGYDVRRELVSWNADEWANIQPGSIYHALKRLTAEGLLVEVATERVGARPARTTYRVTPRGELEFDELLHRYWWEYAAPVDPFLSAYSFLPALTRAEAVLALRHRARTLRTQAQRYQDLVSMRSSWMAQKPQHVGWMFELGLVRAQAEAQWCDQIAARVEAGEGVNAGEDEAAMRRQWRAALGADGDPTATAVE